ncbi:BTB/POZ domain-containing protein POB1 isoform X3 [Physcomitrium patens]|uniref:BTB domain-containing protein n=1 Tax=Physcomitrium patens TaxID=3218 RepID=A0A7I4AB02_PHYPA|nr:BTB/POZ domain-containing protein POB1-like isoform X3 [Physcomitrium patens]|eukprot:XP_024389286.1 BTB/POZ domain-containing protein POB1-like isoform X3 [Physcomitrella patens]
MSAGKRKRRNLTSARERERAGNGLRYLSSPLHRPLLCCDSSLSQKWKFPGVILWLSFVVEGVSKLLGGPVEAQLGEGQEEQVMYVGEDVAPQEADEEAVAMIEEPHGVNSMFSALGDSAGDDGGASSGTWNMDTSVVLRSKTIHISSAILAAKSPYFYKLFSNGMRESEQRDVTLRITQAEESPLMDLLQFMYSGRVQANTPATVLDVLMAADKYEVATCMRYCSRLLKNMPMTSESALLYLELPSSIILAEAVQPLTDAARTYLANCYRDITRFIDDVMGLPLAGVEAVLASDDLQVASEDSVYDFAVHWARHHYPKLEERREVLGSRLVWLIRFPMMSSRKLRKVLTCTDFEHELASKLVLEALFFKAEPSHRQRQLAMEETMHKRYCERAYKYRPVKVVDFDTSSQCLVYLDLKLDECRALYPQGRVYTQAFHLGGQGFFLSAHCNLDQQGQYKCFGLFLGMQEKGSVSFAVDYEFAARMKPTWEFTPKSKGSYVFTGGKAVGYRNLFGMQWQDFIAEGSPYFRNNIVHLRAELTIKKSPSG